MHRSDFAEKTFAQVLDAQGRCPEIAHWEKDRSGLIPIEDATVLSKLQEILSSTHKPGPDNWTRDRGCTLHGVNGAGCSFRCANTHRVPVPSSFKLVHAFRNQNQDMWARYSIARTEILTECQRSAKGAKYESVAVLSANQVETGLQENCNEWYAFHGTSVENIADICKKNFRVTLAGTGATWKDGRDGKGIPLYGFGVYFAERVTKADEYGGGGDDDTYSMLLCRVVGGLTQVLTTNEIDVDKLKTDVYDGPYHSVVGDRVAKLGKPYREIVIYDKDQCYPEYVLVYKRHYE